MKHKITSIFIVALLIHVIPSAVGNDHSSSDWIPLFNGKDLKGWVQHNGTATYRVKDAVIVGKTSEGSPNSFLCTRKEYGDFELTFEVLLDDPLNSGVQIRSKSIPKFKNRRVHGPQVEIATNGTAGYVYGEALGTRWLSKNVNEDPTRSPFKSGEWNSYRVLAVGQVIKTWINGVPVANLTDDITDMSSGFIGLQVHSIKSGTGPFEVRWRNLKIRDLTPKKKDKKK